MSSKNPYKSNGMFEGASHLIFANAKHLRKNMTGAETVLWMHLKKGINNFKSGSSLKDFAGKQFTKTKHSSKSRV